MVSKQNVHVYMNWSVSGDTNAASFFQHWLIEDGKIVAVRPPDPDADDSDVDIADGVADSVEVIMNDEDETSDWMMCTIFCFLWYNTCKCERSKDEYKR